MFWSHYFCQSVIVSWIPSQRLTKHATLRRWWLMGQGKPEAGSRGQVGRIAAPYQGTEELFMNG